MFPRGRRPPTTPGEVPLHRLQRQRGAGRKPAELAIPFVIVGGHGSPVTRRTPSPPPDWPSDMEDLEPRTLVVEPTLRTRDRIPTPHLGGFSRHRSSSAPPSAGAGSRNMYYFDDGETTLVASDQSDEVSSLTLVGESSFSEYDSDDSDNSNDEEYSDDDDDDDEENENDESDNDEETGTYYMESPIQEQYARRERTFEVEVSEEEYFQEEHEEQEEETSVEYVESPEIREEEMVDQSEFDLLMLSAVGARKAKQQDYVQNVIQSPNDSVIEYAEDSDYSMETGVRKMPKGQIKGSQQSVDVGIEESRWQAPVIQRVEQVASGPTPFPGTPPAQENEFIRTNPIPAEDGERFLDSRVYEDSPTPRGNSRWFGRPLEWTPGKNFFEGQEQWASDWEGRALGSPLSCKGNRRVAVEGPKTELQPAAQVKCEDSELTPYASEIEENRENTTIEYGEAELEPYTLEPEVEIRDTAVGHNKNKLEPYTPQPNIDDLEPYTPQPEVNSENITIGHEDDKLEPYTNELKWYEWDRNIVYEGGELMPYTPELRIDRQNTNIIHNEQSLGHPMSAAEMILPQRDVRPSLGHTLSTAMEEKSNSETNEDHYLGYSPVYAPQINEPLVGSEKVNENSLHQLPAAGDSEVGIGYGGGDDNDHMDDDDNDRMYAFGAKISSEHRTTPFEGRKVRRTGSPNVFNMPLPPSEFDSSDERPLLPIISDHTNAIMTLPPPSDLNSGDECLFSPMHTGCITTAHPQALPANNCGRPPRPQLPPPQHTYTMPDYNERNAISQSQRDNSDFSSPPTVGWGTLLPENWSKLPEMVNDYQEGMDQQSSCDGDDEESEDGSRNSIAHAKYPPANIAPDSAVDGTRGSNLNNLDPLLEAEQEQPEVDNSAVEEGEEGEEEEARVNTNRRLFALVDTTVDIPQNSARPQARPSWLKSIPNPAEVLQAKLPTPEYTDLGTSIPAFRSLKENDRKIPLTKPIITKQHRVRKAHSHKSIFGFDDPIVTRYFEDRKKEIRDAAREASAKLEAPWLKRVQIPRPKPWYLMTCIDDVPETFMGHIPKTANYEPISPTPAKINKKRCASWDSRDDNPKKQRVDAGHPDEPLKRHHDMLNKLMKKRKYKSPGIFKSTERFLDGTLVHPIDTSHRLDCFLAVATGKEFCFPAKEQESAWEHCGQEAMFGEYGLVSEMGMGEKARELWAGKSGK
ncbi:hypothetical protein P167DRAFT_550037 [Morchella conica CCBAS932]|uniref:Uncharacterized protein n=1 Tax=Morchella conica CCBAS932 TaxID=1392247 RepID=A0A3N4KCP5_9PEZI|nr:hypothetical protein P167DRAFT_550037 [Morchella conica CCBAS932]